MVIDVHTAWPEERGHMVGANTHSWSTYSAGRTEGREAAFVTLIEVQEDKADRQIQSVAADGPDTVRVELADGRVHRWQAEGMDGEEDRAAVTLSLVEEQADGEIRAEKTN